MFLAKHSPLIGYHGNNEWPIPKLSILIDDLYNCLKSQKAWWWLAEMFLRYLGKTLRGILPPPPIQLRWLLKISRQILLLETKISL